MKFPKLTRRRFLGLGLGTASVLAAEGFLFEPKWVKTNTLRVSEGSTKQRLVQISDIHHKGDRVYLDSVVAKVNELDPDFVCFTGDLVEQSKFLPEALEGLEKIKAPLFGVPGNHDYMSNSDFKVIGRSFEKSGGKWLLNESVSLNHGELNLIGGICDRIEVLRPKPGKRNLLMMHFPLFIEDLSDMKFDLILAGHSHGGQVRVPFYGSLIVPSRVGKYDMGMYQTKSGPMYVNPGIGYFYLDVRFNCRPEITVFEI